MLKQLTHVLVEQNIGADCSTPELELRDMGAIYGGF